MKDFILSFLGELLTIGVAVGSAMVISAYDWRVYVVLLMILTFVMSSVVLPRRRLAFIAGAFSAAVVFLLVAYYFDFVVAAPDESTTTMADFTIWITRALTLQGSALIAGGVSVGLLIVAWLGLRVDLVHFRFRSG